MEVVGALRAGERDRPWVATAPGWEQVQLCGLHSLHVTLPLISGKVRVQASAGGASSLEKENMPPPHRGAGGEGFVSPGSAGKHSPYSRCQM